MLVRSPFPLPPPAWALLAGGVLLGLTGAGARSQAAPQSPQHPNVIVVLVDDMGYGDLSCYGGKRARTPNVDRLAAEGIRFTQFYVNAPICSPSRTAIVTGQYPARWRITSYIDNRKMNQDRGMAQFLDPKAPSFARALQQAGYATGHFGKWHMGGGRDVGEAPLIRDYGFDASLTQFEGLGDRLLPRMDVHDGTPAPKYGLGVMSEKLGRGKVTWMDRCQVTKGFVDRTIDFIRQSETANKPFYVNVWPDDVHSPFFPPKELRGDSTKKKLYDGVEENMDAQLASLFDFVRNDPKLARNTLILLLSDNGPEPGAGGAGPFRGFKGQLYEGGVREPLIAWGPGVIPSARCGTTDDTTVIASVDFTPSLLRFTGAHASEGSAQDGVDRLAALTGTPAPERGKPLLWKRPPDRPGTPDNPTPDLSVREGDWKLLLQEDGSRVQLYHLPDDPHENKNLAEQQPDRVKHLKELVFQWNATLPKTPVTGAQTGRNPFAPGGALAARITGDFWSAAND